MIKKIDKNIAKKIVASFGIILCMAGSSGCQKKLGGHQYTDTSIGSTQSAESAIILSMRVVQINGNEDNKLMGTGIGALAGGAAASTIGQGNGSILAATGGALLGALLGNLISEKAAEQEAYEYTVQRISDKKKFIVVQVDETPLKCGQHVLLIDNDGNKGRRARIIPDHTY